MEDRIAIDRRPELFIIIYREDSGHYRTICSESWIGLGKHGFSSADDQKIINIYKKEIELFLKKTGSLILHRDFPGSVSYLVN